MYSSAFLLSIGIALGSQSSESRESVRKQAQKSTRSKPSLSYVRVLLEEKKIMAGSLWTLTTKGSFIVSDVRNPKRSEAFPSSTLKIALAGKALFCNGKRLTSDKIKIESTTGTVSCGNYQYEGTFFVIYKEGSAFLINRIESEKYVAAGLRWEMLPRWKESALMSGAIVYRTYLEEVRSKAYKRNKDRDYDIRCTPVHQTYKGRHDCACIHEAVRKTAGLVLTYRKEPITALYDACCGGSVPSKREGMDFEKAPYLARGYPCTYCKKFQYYKWRCSYPLKEVTRLLIGHLRKSGKVTDMRVSLRDKAGAARELKVKVGNEWAVMSAQKLPQILKDIKSCTFKISKKGAALEFDGGGYGHQYGFCQWGAQGLAERNWDYKRILRFYYPGTTIAKYTHPSS